MAPIAPRSPDRVAETVACAPAQRRPIGPSPGRVRSPSRSTPRWTSCSTADRRVIVFGEDVGVKGGVYGVTARAGPPVRRRPGLRHPARRAVDPRSWAGRRAGRPDPDPGDPVPGLPAQRRGSTARRGGHAALLLPRPLQQPDGGPDRRTWLPEGLRRALPQRQRGGGAARHSRTGGGLPGRADDAAAMLRTCVAAAVTDCDGVGVPGADRALPPARSLRSRRSGLAGR